MSNFVYKGNDLATTDFQQFDSSTLIMGLIAIESAVPGTLANILRQAALANDGWRLTSNVSDPIRSIQAQNDLFDWLAKFQRALHEQTQEGVQNE